MGITYSCIREQEGNWVFIDMIEGGFSCLIVETRGCHSSENTGTTSGDESIEKRQTLRQQQYKHHIAMQNQDA